MNIDHVIILSAGLGTRMGPVGKHLPKCLWPIFEKTLLELQISFARSLNIKSIFVNTHHQHQLVHQDILEKNKDIHILYEPELLGSGGCIHNFKSKVSECGDSLLILNGDLFYFFNTDLYKKALERLKDVHAVLFGLPVKKDNSYNELIIKNNFLQEIRSPRGIAPYVTHSGVSLINLKKLKEVRGYSNYWESVADYKNGPVEVVFPEKFEYLDFGTLELYKKNIRKILKYQIENKHYLGEDFFRLQNIFDLKMIDKINFSYNGGGQREILNFSKRSSFLESDKGKIFLNEGDFI